MMKNGILTFLFAFCPGAGQMYQGYMTVSYTHLALAGLRWPCVQLLPEIQQLVYSAGARCV